MQMEFFQEFSTVIRVVAPSRWLTTLASKQLSVLGINPEYVPNFHPTRPLNSIKTISRFDSGRALKLGVASANLSSYLKGGDLTDALLQEIKQRRIPAEMIYLRDFSDLADGIELFWSSIDFLLVLSRADNSPNVIHEARIHGVPVIGTDVGGIPELLDNSFDIKIEAKDAEVPFLSELIENLVLRKVEYSKATPPAFEYSSDSIHKIAGIYRGLSI
jgi:glycosyltransferase involved in cell wall biosynthesis